MQNKPECKGARTGVGGPDLVATTGLATLEGNTKLAKRAKGG